jgi:colanic acid/amylovoran biosynthesis glycosyltransferase
MSFAESFFGRPKDEERMASHGAGPSGESRPRFSVVIPAHDEEHVIGACLASLGDAARTGEVVVVANGCTDRTAQVAGDVPGVRVLQVPAAGKAQAIRLGEEACTAFPRIYLDADVVLSAGALAALVAALDVPEARVAAPRVVFDDAASSAAVRAFYRCYRRLPYVADALVGLGVYGLSRAGRQRFAVFPDVVADDLFVQSLFRPSERTVLAGHHFTVRAPRTLRDLIAVRSRTVQGNDQLRRSGLSPAAAPTAGRTLAHLARQASGGPGAAVDAVAYAGVVVGARIRARRRDLPWQRDESSRRPAAHPGTLRVAYLVSQYPALSHTFIHREVAGLRSLGAQVSTFTVRPCPEGDLRSPQLREEAGRTAALLGPEGARRRLPELARLAVRDAGALLPLLADVLRDRRTGPRARLRQTFYLAEAVLFLDRLRAADLHHVHVHFANNGADVARAACRLGERVGYRLTWSFTMHGPTEFEDPEGYDLAGKASSAAFVACISDYCRARLADLVPLGARNRLAVVRMGVVPATFPARPPAEVDADDGTPGPLKVLFVGRLVPEKRPLDLVRALAKATAEGLDLRARFVGTGPLAGALRAAVVANQLADRVELVGGQSEAEMPDHYAWAEVLCLPSEAEGLPVVLMEAMASEVPVVTTRIAAVPELVDDARTGLLIDPGDVGALAGALVRLAADPELRVRLGRAGREAVLRDHDAGLNARVLVDLLARVTTPQNLGGDRVA